MAVESILYTQRICAAIIRIPSRPLNVKTGVFSSQAGFTPNGDGKNDKFRAAAFCPVPKYHLIVFNRNGEKVFETSDPNDGWDGSYKGKKATIGAYVFYSEYFDFVLKRTLTDKGTVVLLQ